MEAVARPPQVAVALTVGFAAAVLVLNLSPAISLLIGIALALTVGSPWPAGAQRLARVGLGVAIIALGAGMKLATVLRVGLHGLGYTALGITVALGLGYGLGRAWRVPRTPTLLISVGTAICGGTAIASAAAASGASDEEASMALVPVFVLNGLALWIFPLVGRALHLGQESFGLWCALAIHDTSSVLGAAATYGTRALEIATAAKLARALWIVPVTLAISLRRGKSARLRVPWFIPGFIAAAALCNALPPLRDLGQALGQLAPRLFALTLFCIGLGFSRGALRSLDVRPLAVAALLWIVLAGGSLAAISLGAV